MSGNILSVTPLLHANGEDSYRSRTRPDIGDKEDKGAALRTIANTQKSIVIAENASGIPYQLDIQVDLWKGHQPGALAIAVALNRCQN